MTTDRDDRDARVLELWRPEEPPPGFAERVVASSSPRPAVGRPWTRRATYAAVAVAVAAAAVVVLMVLWRPASPGSGARITAERETITMGPATAVAEAGAVVAWRVERGATVVEQLAGDVFYRVERGGGGFEVHTPAGTVEVQGTCVRVEVSPMTRDKVVAGAIGAALAVVVTVAVYEGRVIVRERDRPARELSAGEHARLAPAAPAREDTPARAATPAASTAALAGAEAATTPREQTQAARIAELERQVETLRKDLAIARGDEPGQPAPDKHFDFTAEELKWMAERCQLRYDMPGYTLSSTPLEITPERAAGAGLTADEAARVQTVLRTGNEQFLGDLRAIYMEVIGVNEVADEVSPRSLQHELFEKLPEAELRAAFQRMSAERAGLVPPPPDPAARPAAERLLRLLLGTGDELERRYADALGPTRAHELRRAGLGFASRSQGGCPR